MFAVLGAGAMGVDVGFTVYGSRQAQAIADTAAADVIQYIVTADATYTNTTQYQQYLNTKLAGVLTDNNSDAKLTVTPMLYQNGVYTVPGNGLGCAATLPYNPAVPICNAVAVNATQSVPQPFWGGFNSLAGKSGSGLPAGSGCGSGGSGGCGIGCSGYTACFSCPTGGCTTCPTTACYQLQPQGCLSIGTYLANFNSQQTGVLNDVLGQLGTGTALSITAAGYQGLANSYVSLNQLISADPSVLSPTNVLTTSLSSGSLISLFVAAVSNQQQSGLCSSGTSEQTAALAALGGMSGGSASFELCQLISVDGSTCTSAGLTYADLSSGINVLQAVTTAAELANGSNGISVNIGGALGITGLTANLSLKVIQPAQVAFGPVGSVTSPASGCPPSTGTATCAVSSQVAADLTVGIGTYNAIDIPISGADGIATLNNIGCATANPPIKILANTTTATADVTIAGVPLVDLTFAGVATTSLPYTQSVVPPSTTTAGSNPRTIGTTSPTPTVSAASVLWTTTLGTLLSPLDAILGQILQATGVSVGGANVAALGIDCDTIAAAQ